MENISKMWYGPLPKNCANIQTFRMFYAQNGVEKNWDLAKVDDTVAIINYNKTTNKLVLVKQFRPVIHYGDLSKLGCENSDQINMIKYPARLEITLELCTGTVDKNWPLKEIVKKELEEQCGFNVSLDRIEEVMTYRSDVGATGGLETLFYCEVTNNDKVSGGGRVDDEVVDVVEIAMQEAREMVKTGANLNSPPNFIMGLLWFFRNKAPQ